MTVEFYKSNREAFMGSINANVFRLMYLKNKKIKSYVCLDNDISNRYKNQISRSITRANKVIRSLILMKFNTIDELEFIFKSIPLLQTDILEVINKIINNKPNKLVKEELKIDAWIHRSYIKQLSEKSALAMVFENHTIIYLSIIIFIFLIAPWGIKYISFMDNTLKFLISVGLYIIAIILVLLVYKVADQIINVSFINKTKSRHTFGLAQKHRDMVENVMDILKKKV